MVSKIYIATDSSPVDMQSYELCCDMIGELYICCKIYKISHNCVFVCVCVCVLAVCVYVLAVCVYVLAVCACVFASCVCLCVYVLVVCVCVCVCVCVWCGFRCGDRCIMHLWATGGWRGVCL